MRARLLVLAPALLVGGCAREELLHDLDERQASEVVVALDDGGIAARKARPGGAEGGYTVEVSPDDAPRALRVLAERDLPRPRPPGFGEVFAKGGLVPTPTEERARYQQAVSGELARSLESVDGVVGARVHIALADPDPLHPGERPPPRASVLIRCRPSACAAIRELEPGFRALVAGSADRLEAAAVSVVMTEAREAARAEPPPRPRPGLAVILSMVASAGALGALAVWVRTRLRRGQALARTGSAS